jgi:hypothetical protein
MHFWRFKFFCGSFLTSLLFLIIASVMNFSYGFIEYTDILIALVLVILAIVIYVKRSTNKKKGSRKLTIGIYKSIFFVILILLLLFLIDLRIKWNILLVGLAWRFWLLSLILEELVDLYRKRDPQKPERFQINL